MGKSRTNQSMESEAPKRRGRVVGAKSYKVGTLYKIINEFKPASMLVWGTVAEHYRRECGELEARPAATIKKFFFRKCVTA